MAGEVLPLLCEDLLEEEDGEAPMLRSLSTTRTTPTNSWIGPVSEDVVFDIATHLDPPSLCSFAAVTSGFEQLSREEALWESVAEGLLAPHSVAGFRTFQSTAAWMCLHSGESCWTSLASKKEDNERMETAGGFTCRQLCQAHQAARAVLAVDLGQGYTKFGYASSCQRLGVLQLCSSPTHPAEAARSRQVDVLMRRAGKPLGFRAPSAILVGEPFYLPSDAEADKWRKEFLQPQLPSSIQCLCLPQPLLALLAHGVHRDGIVVNLGQREAAAVPCLDGCVWRSASCGHGDISGAVLTNSLYQLLGRRNVGVELTRCRDLKEQHCAVSPTPLSREEGPVHHAPPVQVSHGGIRFELGLERFLVPEVLFQGRRSLPWLVHEAGRRAVAMVPPKERPATWARLLGSVVVVGGTAMLPGLRSRLQSELQERVDSTEFLMTEGLEDPPKVHVLEPLPKSGGPRVAVFYGLQLAAVAACAGGIVRTEDLASPKGFAPHDNPGRPNADCACCQAWWKRTTSGLRAFRELLPIFAMTALAATVALISSAVAIVSSIFRRRSPTATDNF